MIAQGAEAKLIRKGDSLLKDRFEKSYRLPEIDRRLRRSRTKREAKVLQKLEALEFPAPRLAEQQETVLSMSFLDGRQVKDYLTAGNCEKSCKEIGKKVAFLHDHEIIHGDLTTSNMIMMKEVHFIDFGLSFFSKKVEDKAVDVHLFRQALESKHHQFWEKAYSAFLEGYKPQMRTEILSRLEKVEQRGRYKGKK